MKTVLAVVLTLVTTTAQAQDGPEVRDLNRRVTAIEKALTDAGRTFLFRNEVGGVKDFPRPMPGPTVTYRSSAPAVVRTTTTTVRTTATSSVALAGPAVAFYGSRGKTVGAAVASARGTQYTTPFAPVRRTLYALGSVGSRN